MKKMIIAIAFLALLLPIQAQFDAFRFQGQIELKSSNTKPSHIGIKILLRKDGKNEEYAETHRPTLSPKGVFSLDIGKGTPLHGTFSELDFTKEWLVEVFVDPANQQQWTPAGSSPLRHFPYANACLQSLDSTLHITESLTFVADTASLLSLHHDGSINSGSNNYPWQYISTAPNQRIYLSTSSDKPLEAAMINFHWTIQSSKPAIVTYDENFIRHYAVVAHYWSNSGRAHQHISMEVDDLSGAVQTRFELPWGNEHITVESHSANFRIADKGNLYVGNENGLTSPYAMIHKNAFAHQRLFTGTTTPTPTTAQWVIAAKNKESTLNIHQDNESNPSALRLATLSLNYILAHHAGGLYISNLSDNILQINKDGRVGMGMSASKFALEVNGSIRSNSILSSRSIVAEYKEKEEEIAAGDVVGINPLSGKIRKFVAGDIFYGIGTLLSDVAVRLNYGNPNAALVAVQGPALYKNSQVQIKDGKVFTLSGQYIGIRLPRNYVILTGRP